MASQIQIINVALSRIGANEITALDEATVESKLAVMLWEIARKATLRDHPWNFAITEVELSKLAVPATYNYSYSYQLPAGCVRLLEVYDCRDFKVAGRNIQTDNDTITIRYISDVTDTAMWDALFTDAMAQRLAAELAYPLTKSQATADTQVTLYERKLAKARFVDSSEDIQDAIGQSDSWLISSRF